MKEINEDDLIMYEESKEIKETIWKIWDIINDKEIIKKLILNSSLLKDIKASLSNELLEEKEKEKENNIKENATENTGNANISKKNSEEKGK